MRRRLNKGVEVADELNSVEKMFVLVAGTKPVECDCVFVHPFQQGEPLSNAHRFRLLKDSLKTVYGISVCYHVRLY